MVVVPIGDPFLAADGAERAAAEGGRPGRALEGRGHWWMLEDPAAAAELLTAFWSTV